MSASQREAMHVGHGDVQGKPLTRPYKSRLAKFREDLRQSYEVYCMDLAPSRMNWHIAALRVKPERLRIERDQGGGTVKAFQLRDKKLEESDCGCDCPVLARGG